MKSLIYPNNFGDVHFAKKIVHFKCTIRYFSDVCKTVSNILILFGKFSAYVCPNLLYKHSQKFMTLGEHEQAHKNSESNFFGLCL